MEKEALKRIFDFLEAKEGENSPVKWKIINNEPLLEEDLNVYGDLDFRFSSITSLPEGLNVGRDLDLHYSKITSLPKGLKVGGWLDLSDSDIEFLPKGLKVVGDLDLRYTEINSLPKGLKVGGDLLIFGTPIAKFDDDELREMIKPGFIKGEILE